MMHAGHGAVMGNIAIFALLLVNIPVSVGMWYAGDAARVFFQQVGLMKA